MKRVRALTGFPRLLLRGRALRQTALAALLALSLLALAPAMPALAEGQVSAEELNRLALTLDGQVAAAEGQSAPVADEGDVPALGEVELLAATELPEGQTRTFDVEPDAVATFEFTVDADDLVSIRASATGATSEVNRLVGTFDLKLGDLKLDTVRLFQGNTEDAWFPLTAGTYTIEYRNAGASSARTLSLFWSSQGQDLDGGQLTLPNNRTYATALPVATNRLIHGVFYWGYNASNPDSKLDGHYYEFKLDKRSAVTLVLGNPGDAQIAMMDGSGKVVESDGGAPMAATGSGSISVDCGALKAGTYRILVISTDPAAWKRHYVAEVFSYPVDAQPSVSRNVYRLYNQWSGEHLFTANLAERNANALAGWKDEGVAWVAPTTGDPVWRLANPYSGEHLYTRSASERSGLIAAGWKDEGLAWYSDGSMGRPVYRLFNPYRQGTVAAHHYTVDANEYRTLGDQGWQQEGECWYGLR